MEGGNDEIKCNKPLVEIAYYRVNGEVMKNEKTSEYEVVLSPRMKEKIDNAVKKYKTYKRDIEVITGYGEVRFIEKSGIKKILEKISLNTPVELYINSEMALSDLYETIKYLIEIKGGHITVIGKN